MRLAAYIRVSTDGQIDAFGKDVQIELIEKFVAKNPGWEIIKFYEDDGVSGKTEGLSRPAIVQILTDVEDGELGIEAIIALDPSRYAREFFVQETLYGLFWAKDLKIFCANGGEVLEDDESDPMRKFMRRIFGLLAELERDTLYMRLHNGRRRKIESGGYGGGTPPFGWEVQGRKGSAELVPCAREQAVIQSIYQMRDSGLSYKKIAQSLNSAGIKTKRNCVWRERQISRILEERES